MSREPPPINEETWTASLLAVDTELLLAAARNYLGPVKTPYDKRIIAEKLTAFLKRPDIKKALLGLLDPLDARIIGSLLLLGTAREDELRSLFTGELPLFDLGLRIANLQDRLILFRLEIEREKYLAVNPLLAEELRGSLLCPDILFGDRTGTARGAVRDADEVEKAVGPDVLIVLALFGFLFQTPGALRKGEELTKRGGERAALLLPDFSRRKPLLDALSRSLGAAGALRREEGGGVEANPTVFAALLRTWGRNLPCYLVVAHAVETGQGLANYEGPSAVSSALVSVLAETLAAMPRDLPLSRGGLRRWLGIRRLLAPSPELLPPPADVVKSLEALGLLLPVGEDCVIPAPALERDGLAAPSTTDEEGRDLPSTRPVLVAEGSHLLHLLPEASLEDRLFVLLLAEPRSIGPVWTLELSRESTRRGFATGIGARDAIARLQRLGGRPLPQSLSFSLQSWEEEYRSLRLYHGFVLAADERMRNLIDHSKALGSIIAERLGAGLYVLAARNYEEVSAALAAAGLEAPPESRPELPATTRAEQMEEKREIFRKDRSSGNVRFPDAAARAARPSLDPDSRIAVLKEALEARSGLTAEQRRQLEDRIDRRLILDEEQLGRAELKIEHLEAAGLDYLGKVRVVERALRSRGDRLDILYRLPGTDPVRALLRPVRLDKTEKGLVLEAENLGTGGPVRVPLGAASSVRRLRASLFGEES